MVWSRPTARTTDGAAVVRETRSPSGTAAEHGRRERHTRQYQVTRRQTDQLAPARPEIVAQTGRRRAPRASPGPLASPLGEVKPSSTSASRATMAAASPLISTRSFHRRMRTDVDASAQLGEGGHGIGLLARQGLANQGGRIVGREEATIVFEYGDGVAAEQAISGIGIDDVHRAAIRA